ncbi:bifunctional heptose 7-phosphate kinase/heptose 1-phosphate adenyltransferase [Synoicihabitans lomoniglobus]|uniref:PfkB family carbohydrate kinase n=1 Tax=Synoicihabitans lomoniglobus TaxID=2909285 RepID=A0AAF0I860_9BACT|nr:PfkB family carbohydrate kinase [Opitutaceae bacterium LMO-M01]WED67366.1 PfkB family carbohydrate kinase [Opitutaceae bacterium LMO-M01]
MTPLSLDFLDRISVLVVGDVMLDRYIWGDIRRISPEAPVPVVEIDRETCTAGGAANVALNLAALGVSCEIFGAFGCDAAGEELSCLLKKHHVAFEPRLARNGTATITKTRVLAQNQQVCRLDREERPPLYTLAVGGLMDLLAEKSMQYSAVIISDYAKGTIDQAVIDRLRQVCKEKNVFLSLDPKPTRSLEISGFNLLTPNRREANLLAGLPAHCSFEQCAAEDVAQLVIDRHRPEHMVMTLSENGMLLKSRERSARHFPTIAHQVADVSGAGDTVVATLTAAMSAGLSPEDAVHIANTAAGVVVSKLGTATVTRSELSKALHLPSI